MEKYKKNNKKHECKDTGCRLGTYNKEDRSYFLWNSEKVVKDIDQILRMITDLTEKVYERAFSIGARILIRTEIERSYSSYEGRVAIGVTGYFDEWEDSYIPSHAIRESAQ